jgi:hypothetical protein
VAPALRPALLALALSLLALSLLALAAAGAAAPATPPVCPAVPLDERIAQADAAFVGRLGSERAAPGGGRVYRFLVDQHVKGPLGREIEIRAPALTDAAGDPVPHDVAVGVLARRDGAAWVTDSCSLTEPGALLSAADEPKGNWIKLVIGLVILTLVLAYSARRLRRRQLQQPDVHRRPPPRVGNG